MTVALKGFRLSLDRSALKKKKKSRNLNFEELAQFFEYWQQSLEILKH